MFPPLGRAQDTASFTLLEQGKTAAVMDWLHEFQGALPDGTGGTRLCWDLMPAVWTAQPELLQPTGWEAAPLLQGTNVKAEYDRVHRRTGRAARVIRLHPARRILYLPRDL